MQELLQRYNGDEEVSSIEAILKFGHTEHLDASSEHDAVRAAATAQTAIMNIALALESDVNRTRSSRHLTPEGVTAELQGHGRKAMKALQELRQSRAVTIPLGDRNQLDNQRQKRIDDALGGVEPVLAVETRRALTQLDRSERRRAVRQAVQENDVVTISAIRNAPVAVRRQILEQVEIDDAFEQWASIHHAIEPAHAEIGDAARILEGNLSDVERGIEKITGLSQHVST